MDQGTAQWLQWKRPRIGSSDSAAVFGASEWLTPRQLVKRLSGKAVPEVKSNWAMNKGTRWEPAARARFELKSDMDFPPTIVVHPQHKNVIASLDGQNKDAKAILEIKVPGQKIFQAAKYGIVEDSPKDKIKYKRFVKEWNIKKFCEGEGIVHPKYYCQVQHQMMCAQAEICYFYVCMVEMVHGQEQIVDEATVVVHADPEFQRELLFKELQMLDFAAKGILPQPTADDIVELDDQSSVILFAEIKKAKIEYDALSAQLEAVAGKQAEAKVRFEELKEEAIEHVESLEHRHTKYSCLGVSFTKSKKGHWIVTLDRNESCDELSRQA